MSWPRKLAHQDSDHFRGFSMWWFVQSGLHGARMDFLVLELKSRVQDLFLLPERFACDLEPQKPSSGHAPAGLSSMNHKMQPLHSSERFYEIPKVDISQFHKTGITLWLWGLVHGISSLKPKKSRNLQFHHHRYPLAEHSGNIWHFRWRLRLGKGP